MDRRSFIRRMLVASATVLVSKPLVDTLIRTVESESLVESFGGQEFLDAMAKGYIYAPYIPLHITPMFNPNDYDEHVRRTVLTRYASRKINPKYYGVVTIKSNRTLDVLKRILRQRS
jgi:hypothetical protein